MFSFVISELLAAYNTAKTYLGERTADLGSEQAGYVDQCLRFVFFAYVFFADEPKVKALFDRVRSFAAPASKQQDA